MDKTETITGQLAENVKELLRIPYYGKHLGLVVDNQDLDPRSGRVKCTIPGLGRFTPADAIWAYPIQNHAQITPDIGEPVAVGFLIGENGYPDVAYYEALPAALADAIPTRYLNSTTNVVFQSPLLGKGIVFNDVTGEMNIDYGAAGLKLGDVLTAIEPFVLGTPLQAFLAGLIIAYNAHTHSGVVAGGGVSGPPVAPETAPSGLLSTQVFAQ